MKDEKKEIPDCCQVCKSHANKPSRCHAHGNFVSRKHKPCDLFNRRAK
jgi:hypothetical protein